MTKETITVAEVFGVTIQGEGPLIGRPTIFVRTGGCDFRCTWCDSMHAVDPKHRPEWEELTARQIMVRIGDLLGVNAGAVNRDVLITLSGGNPALQPMDELLRLGRVSGFKFAMETQGSVCREWFEHLDYLILSPKGPSANVPMHPLKLGNSLDDCINAVRRGDGIRRDVCFKIVIFNDADYDFARALSREFIYVPMYLQVGTDQLPAEGERAWPGIISREQALSQNILDRMRWLIGKVRDDRWFDVTVLPQLHVLLWGDQKGV